MALNNLGVRNIALERDRVEFRTELSAQLGRAVTPSMFWALDGSFYTPLMQSFFWGLCDVVLQGRDD